MASSYEKSVKNGTKIKLAAPKSKYVEHILQATHTGEAGVAEIFRTMHNRLRDSTWTIVFKGLIITHLMIREGQPKATLKYLADNQSKMAISNFSDVQVQGENIRYYHKYLQSRVRAYATTEEDWVLNGKGKLQKLTIDKGLLRQTEAVQAQISALLKCDLFAKETENEITLTAFRLLTMDLLALYHVSNEGAINVLERYFEMSKTDAERALRIYRTFAKQTDSVVAFLSVARQYEAATRLEIPKLKHAPTGLASSLEEYLHDPDFEINRRQYMLQKEAKKNGTASSSKKPAAETSKPITNGSSSGNASSSIPSQQSQQQPKGPAPDLIDFFESIEQNQQPMMTAPAPQAGQYGFQQQPAFTGQMPQAVTYSSTNPFASMMTQPQQQEFANGQQAQQPFMTGAQSDFSQPQNQQQSIFGAPQQSFAPQQPSMQPGVQPFFTGSPPPAQPPVQSPNFLQPQATGTNPFRTSMIPQQSGVLPPSSPQSTNPFRSSTMPAAQTGPSPFTSSAPTSATQSFFSSIQSPTSPQSFHSTQSVQPLQPNQTGTNPFKSNFQPAVAPIATQQTGTNPFRQSAFVNQQTGQGWQAHQGTMGGLEQLPTVPVFPRPAGQQTWPS